MALYRHRFSGGTASGDIWVFTWWSDGSSSLSATQSAAVQWLTQFWDGDGTVPGFGSMVVPGVVATQVTTAVVDPATGLQSELAEDDVSLPGSAVPPSMPADVAIVVTLRTTLANRRGRGRFFLPQPASGTATDTGRMLSTVQNNLISSLEFAWQGYSSVGSPVVYSRMNRDSRTVVTFNVGDLFDTQRRRENALTETRASGTMP